MISGRCSPGRERRDADGSEPLGEADVLLGVEALVAEEQHQVLEQRPAHGRDGGVVEVGGEVDPADLRADGGREACNLHRRTGCTDAAMAASSSTTRPMAA